MTSCFKVLKLCETSANFKKNGVLNNSFHFHSNCEMLWQYQVQIHGSNSCTPNRHANMHSLFPSLSCFPILQHVRELWIKNKRIQILNLMDWWGACLSNISLSIFRRVKQWILDAAQGNSWKYSKICNLVTCMPEWGAPYILFAEHTHPSFFGGWVTFDFLYIVMQTFGLWE